MLADRQWVERNLGFDPITTPPPRETFTVKRMADAAVKKTAKVETEDFRREIIDFDSESTEGRAFMAFSTSTGLSRFTDITWPKGLAPQTGPKPKGNGKGPLPRADVLVVTWTVDEGHALSRVLTPGKDSRNDYVPYTHNYATISKKMRNGCPARELKRLGTYWTTTIGKKKVVIFKSDSHMSQDGPELPNSDVWRQIITEVQPTLVITTGTAGGIGKEFEVGDVGLTDRAFRLPVEVQEAAFRAGALFQQVRRDEKICAGEDAVQGQCRAIAKGQHQAAEDLRGETERTVVLRGHH
ncbi:phosphorylase family protein [Bradyrhizobium canariense]|uniref:phosphorylase family protein n=1 Tax=Bradyrhizobium canariense TaxID=255045 RepID=UPI001FE81D33|nr:hypothetical protein [Bradyrhizobium canariense]